MRRERVATWLGILIGTVCAVLLAGRAWASEPLTQEFHQTYALSADGRVELENINGPSTLLAGIAMKSKSMR